MPDLTLALRTVARALRMTTHRADTAETRLRWLKTQYATQRDTIRELSERRTADRTEIERLRAHLADLAPRAGIAAEIEPGLFLERCVCGDTELVSGECESLEFHAGHPACRADPPTVDQFWATYPTAGQL